MAHHRESFENSSYLSSEKTEDSRGSKIKSLFSWKDMKDRDNDNYEVVGVKDCKLKTASIAPFL